MLVVLQDPERGPIAGPRSGQSATWALQGAGGSAAVLCGSRARPLPAARAEPAGSVGTEKLEKNWGDFYSRQIFILD